MVTGEEISVRSKMSQGPQTADVARGYFYDVALPV